MACGAVAVTLTAVARPSAPCPKVLFLRAKAPASIPTWSTIGSPMISPSSLAFLKRLLDAPAPSGFETAASRAWRAEAEQFAHKVSVDVTGNSMAEVNPGGHPTIMLDGHIDEIGVIVQYIDDDGFIYIAPIGGWDRQGLRGQSIALPGADGVGV